MSTSEAWTVKRLLEWTTDFLKSRGAESARLEAELLLAHAMKCKRIELYTNFDTEPDEEQRTIFRDLVRRRGTGEPVALLVGHKEFYSLDFTVTRDVLIPRPETEHLVLESLDFMKKWGQNSDHAPCRVCDLGTGSGNIIVTIAKNNSLCVPMAIDISEPALAVARQNAQKHNVADRITFVLSDLFSQLPSGTVFDLIVTNPPYVTEAEYKALEPMVRDYEPRKALLAGPDGLAVIGRIADEAHHYLSHQGLLLLEASPMIIEKVRDRFADNGFWTQLDIIKDFNGHPRFLSAAVAAYEK